MTSSRSLSERKQQLSPAKQALLEKKLQQALAAQASAPLIPSRPGADSASLSFSQEQIYFLQQLEPNSPSYNRPLALKLSGPLDKACLRQDLQAIFDRHAVLRSVIQASSGGFMQCCTAQPLFPLPEADLSGLPAEQREGRLQALLVEQSQQPFDLSQAPPVRGLLLCLSPVSHLLLMVFHHIAFDGWSAKIFIEELAALYAAHSTGSEPVLPPLPIQYGDFAEWQRLRLAGPLLHEQLAYWKRQLSDLPEGLSLPYDHPRPARQSYQGAKFTFQMPAELTTSLKAITLQENATLFMGLLASFAGLLYRSTRQADIVLGSPSAGRAYLETENLIGCFLNTLALRVKLEGRLSFRELLGRVRQAVLGAFSHQELPFERLVQELNPVRDLSRTPLFQVLFNLENIPLSAVELEGLKLEPLEFDDQISRFDLSIEITPSGSDLHCCLTYDTSLFEAATIQRLAGHWRALLAGLLADPGRPIQSVPLLSEEERRTLITDWNQTQSAYPSQLCIHQFFEQQVQRTPQATALVFGDCSLTYEELNHKANQMAHCLRQLGVGLETPVGIHLQRSPELVISLLAVLKAGGAYVPLDPDHPPARLETILRDTQAPLVLTQASLRERLPPCSGQILCLDDALARLASQPNHNPGPWAAPGSLAYILYTSGSTGSPKGVMALHRGVTSYLAYLTGVLGLDSQAVVLQITSFNFDPHVREIFGPLSCGAKLVLLSPEQARDPSAILQTIQENQVTGLLSIVPAWLRLLTDQALQSKITCPSLKLVLCGGEILSGSDCTRAAAAFGSQVRLFNQYGPTEYTMASTCFPVPTEPGEPGPLSVGKPVWNTRVYILDEALNPLPVGIPGEIHVAGAGMTRGYLKDPELTQARYIHDPFSEDPQALLYKTGDLGRYTPDGNIQFLGRIDRQLKIRGQRVEPGEIESLLRGHPAVQDCAVRAQPLRPGENALAAYWLAAPDAAASQSELKEYLSQRLPGYMLPGVFLQMEKLPNLPNGKIDLARLPLPAQAERGIPKLTAPPQTHLEQRLAAIWESLLGTSPISIQDNFFELGGHSILVLRLFLEIEKEFQVKLPLASIFKSPTVAGLAQLLAQAVLGKEQSNFTLLQPLGSQPPFFYLHTQHSYSSTILHLAETAGKQQPFYAVQIPLPTKEVSRQTTLEEIARQTLAQVRLIQPHGPYFLGGYSLSGIFAFELARQLAEAGEETALLALIDPSISILPGYYHLLSVPRRLLYRAGFMIYAARLHLGNLKQLPFPKKISYIWQRVAKRLPSKFQPAPASPSTADPYLEPLIIQRQLSRRYRLRPYPGRVVLIKSMDRADHTLEPGWFFDRETSGWKILAGAGVAVVPIPGDHHSIILEQNIDTLAQALAGCIHSAQQTLRDGLKTQT